MSDEVGSASVRIDPDLSFFEEDLKAGLEEATAGDGEEISVTIKEHVDDTEARAKLAEDKALADSFGGDIGSGDDDFMRVLPGVQELDSALAKAGVDADVFTDRMQEAGIETEQLTGFADESGVALDDLVGHLDGAGSSARDMNQYFQQTQTAFAQTGDYARSLGLSMDDLDQTAKDMETDWRGADDVLKDVGNDGNNAATGLRNTSSGAKDAESGMSGLIAAAVTLGPALIPVAGVVTAALIGVGDAALAGGLGIGAFALAAQPEMAGLEDKAKDLLTSFQTLVAPDVIPVLSGSVGLLKDAFQAAVPLVDTTSTALEGLEQRATSALQSPAWHGFTTFIDAEAGPAITTFGTVLGNLGHGFGNLLEAFAPVETQMEHGLESLSSEFEKWTSSTGGLQNFVNWFETEGPQVGRLLENLGSTAGLLLQAFGGWGEILITVANPLLEVVNDLLRVDPVIGEITAAIIVGAVAWSKWGDAVGTGITAIKKAPEAISDAIGVFDNFMLRVSNLGSGFGAAAADSDVLAASEGRGAIAADADAAAQGELAAASTTAAASQTELSGATDLAAASQSGLGVAAAESVGGVAAVGAASEVAGGGFTIAGLSAGELGTALLGISAVALPLGALVGAVALGWGEASQQAKDATTSTAALSQNMEGQGAKTIPQLNAALSNNKTLINDLGNEYTKVNAQYSANSLAVDQNDKQLTALQSTFNDGYTPAVQKIQAENQKLNDEIATQKTNLGELNETLKASGSQTVLNTNSANQLADAIGLNLNKALSGTQIQQFVEYLKQLSTQSGISESAIETLSTEGGETMTAFTKAVQAAGDATQKSFSQAGDLIGHFSGQVQVSGGDILQFYQDQTKQASDFSANIQSALAAGYDPQTIENILEKGPATAGPLLAAMVANESSDYVNQFNAMQKGLAAQQQVAVSSAEDTSKAIQSKNSDLINAIPTALALAQAKAAVAGGETVQAAVAGLNQQFPAWQSVATSLGDTIPKTFQAAEGKANLAGVTQGQAVTKGTLTALLAQANAANQMAALVPTAANKGAAAVADAYYNQGVAASGGITKSKPLVDSATTPLATDLSTKAKSDAGNSQTAGASQGHSLFDGLNSQKLLVDSAATPPATSLSTKTRADTPNVSAAGAAQGSSLFGGINSQFTAIANLSDQTGSQVHQKANAHTTDDRNAGVAQGTSLFGGLSSQFGAIQQQADTTGSQVHLKAATHNSDVNAAGSTQGDQFKQGITSKQGEIEQAANQIGQGVADKIGSGMQGKEGQIASTFLSTVKSAISSTAGSAGGQSVGEAMDNGAAQGASEHEGTIASALLGAVKGAIGTAAAQAGGQSVGAALDNGIAAGIAGSAGVVAAQAAAVVNTAKAAANAAANTKSPSQVFRDEVGAPIGQGIALGIQDQSGMVQGAAAGLINSAVAGLKGPSASLSQPIGVSLAQAASTGITTATALNTAQAPVLQQTNNFYGVGKETQDLINQSIDQNNTKLIQRIGAR